MDRGVGVVLRRCELVGYHVADEIDEEPQPSDANRVAHQLPVPRHSGPWRKRTPGSTSAEIRADAETLWDKIATAYTRRAWAALGYSSWDEYCIREFGTSRLKVPREVRAEMVTSLRHAGLSIRAIASATGASVNTVQADLQVSQTDTPDGELVDEDAVTEAALAAGEPTKFDKLMARVQDTRDVGERGPGDRRWSGKPIIGIDGKTYRPQRKPAPTPTRRHSDNEIKFVLQARSVARALDVLMAFAKALDADAKRKVIEKHRADLESCVAKMAAVVEQIVAVDGKTSRQR